jgi:CrcB protein
MFEATSDGVAGLARVALGGAIGGAGRLFVTGLCARLVGEKFPWGTICVNVLGSLGIGAAAALALGPMGGQHWLFAVVGVLGSFTTVSSFSLQTLALAQSGETLRAGANVAASVMLCLGAAALGFTLALGV